MLAGSVVTAMLEEIVSIFDRYYFYLLLFTPITHPFQSFFRSLARVVQQRSGNGIMKFCYMALRRGEICPGIIQHSLGRSFFLPIKGKGQDTAVARYFCSNLAISLAK